MNDQIGQRSTISPLHFPLDAVLARRSLIDSSTSSLDMQYYQWDSDAVGYLILHSALAAADRGVSVRILVDDMRFTRRTHDVASLCLHPNFEVKLYNPWARRSGGTSQIFEFGMRFRRLNRRMHNKLFITDGESAILGGRNIADTHFGLADRQNLVDFDAKITGPDVPSLTAVFEDYWECPVSRSGSELGVSVTADDLSAARKRIEGRWSSLSSELAHLLAQYSSPNEPEVSSLAPGSVNVVSDSPRSVDSGETVRVVTALREVVSTAKNQIVVVTPFFVPSELDVDWYSSIVESGVEMRVLTNSLASNPGTVSNSGLKKHRRALIDAGVILHELRTDADDKGQWEVPPHRARTLGLHSKLYVVDQRTAVSGSINLDPRSKYINTEVAVAIESSEFAGRAVAPYLRLMEEQNSWSVGVDGERLVWRSGDRVTHRQPAKGPGQRAADAVLGYLPIGNYI